MKIDLFTFIAQIINFLILVFILYKVLFKRLLTLMDARQKKMEDEMASAKKMQEDAAHDKELIAKEKAALENTRLQLLDKMHEEISGQKSVEIEKAKKEVEESEKKWKEELTSKESDFISFLKKQTALMACSISRSVLKDFASATLEQAALNNFKLKLEKLSLSDKEQLKGCSEKIILKSSFALSSDEQNAIKESLKNTIQMPSIEIQFLQDSSFILGIETKIKDIKISFNIDDYLKGLEEKLSTKIAKL